MANDLASERTTAQSSRSTLTGTLALSTNLRITVVLQKQ